MTVETKHQSFQAETKDLLDLMIHSLYTKREIFLRELISNASDALDKLQYESLSDPDLKGNDDILEIRIDVDAESRTLTISDTGIGMTVEEVTQNLGTIARSGTKELRKKMREQGGDGSSEELIGQFGVGFYSAFMVADKVEVLTRRAGETQAVRWESSADGFFDVSEAEKETRGTSVILHLRPADPELGIEDYTQTWRLSDIVQRHSDFVRYPIKMREKSGENDEVEDRTLNSMKPLWKRSQSEVEQKDYDDFYKHLSGDFEDPLKTIVSKAEGVSEYHALLFIPSRAPFDLFYHDPDMGVRLYAKQILIAEKSTDLLPSYLRFVRGVVDAGELPLNISRQHLQHDVHLKKIGKWVTKKVIDTLTSMQSSDSENYDKFWKEFGRALKEGIGTDYENKDRLLSLLRFASSADPEKLTALEAYVERMKEGQEEIYYITGESRSILERSPHLEALAAKEYEVLFMTDPVDEYLLHHLRDFKGKKLKSAAKGTLDLKNDEDKEALEQKKEKFKPLVEFLEKSLDAEVKRVQLSTHLTKSPACMTVDDYEESAWMEQLLQRSQPGAPKRKRIMEINPNHAIVEGLLNRITTDPDDPKNAVFARALVGVAQISEGGNLNDPLAFTDATTELLTLALS